MNYPFKNAVLGFVCGGDAADAADHILSHLRALPSPGAAHRPEFPLHHDTERALTVIADEPAGDRGREWQSGRSVTGEAYEEGPDPAQNGLCHHLHTCRGPLRVLRGRDRDAGLPGPLQPGILPVGQPLGTGCARVIAQLAPAAPELRGFPGEGALRVLRAEGGILHYQRVGAAETAEIIANRTDHLIVEKLASGKYTEVNPLGIHHYGGGSGPQPQPQPTTITADLPGRKKRCILTEIFRPVFGIFQKIVTQFLPGTPKCAGLFFVVFRQTSGAVCPFQPKKA